MHVASHLRRGCVFLMFLSRYSFLKKCYTKNDFCNGKTNEVIIILDF